MWQWSWHLVVCLSNQLSPMPEAHHAGAVVAHERAGAGHEAVVVEHVPRWDMSAVAGEDHRLLALNPVRRRHVRKCPRRTDLRWETRDVQVLDRVRALPLDQTRHRAQAEASVRPADVLAFRGRPRGRACRMSRIDL